jgi:hypothetical protein
VTGREAVLLIVLLASCSRDSSPRTTSSGAGDSLLAGSFQELSAGCLGGITGGGRGVTLFHSGALFKWTQLGAKSEERDSVLVRQDSTMATRLHRQLVRARFRDLTALQPADMSCFLYVRDSLGAHEIVWPIGSETALPGAVRGAYEELMASDP